MIKQTVFFVAVNVVFSSAVVHSQGVPACPTSAVITLVSIAPFSGASGPPVSNLQISLLIGQVATGGVWYYPIQNVIVSGNQIAGTALGVFVPSGFGAPNQPGIFGPVPAGTYTIVVQPIATNVTPNVNCPILQIPLTVLQGFENVPVPAPTGKLAALLAGLLALMAGVTLGRRRAGRNRPR